MLSGQCTYPRLPIIGTPSKIAGSVQSPKSGFQYHLARPLRRKHCMTSAPRTLGDGPDNMQNPCSSSDPIPHIPIPPYDLGPRATKLRFTILTFRVVSAPMGPTANESSIHNTLVLVCETPDLAGDTCRLIGPSACMSWISGWDGWIADLGSGATRTGVRHGTAFLMYRRGDIQPSIYPLRASVMVVVSAGCHGGPPIPLR